jgi:hypothetical protein
VAFPPESCQQLNSISFQFSRRVSILPGLKLDFNGSGVPLSAGVRGADTILDLPGIGLSYRPRFAGKNGPSPTNATGEAFRIFAGD